MKRHLVLIGLPGAGKSVVGQAAAQLLRTPFSDLDREIENAAGQPIQGIFDLLGEPRFRELEREAMSLVVSGLPKVIAPGGGWAAQPGNIDAVADRVLLVWLTVPPEVAAARVGGDAHRPLLSRGDPQAIMQRLLREREPHYRRATAVVDATLGTPEVVAQEVVRVAMALQG